MSIIEMVLSRICVLLTMVKSTQLIEFCICLLLRTYVWSYIQVPVSVYNQ